MTYSLTRLFAETRLVILALLPALLAAPQARSEQFNQVAGELVTLNTNGAWSWYMDERVIVDAAAGKLLASSVADASGTGGAARSGDIDLASYDLAANHLVPGADPFVLHDNLQADDHNGAALLVRPDGRYLAVYTKHNQDKLSRYRVSTRAHDATSWQPEQSFNWDDTPGSDFNATYSNLFYLPAENRTYNFARANNRSPNMMLSDDYGDTWTYGGRLLATPQNVGYVNGYLKYAQNGDDRIDFIATEHHPRDFNNSIYHGYITGGKMYQSDGSLLDGDIFDNDAPTPAELTEVFASDPEDGSQQFTRVWTTDLHIDAQGHPYAIFTARANDIPVNTNGYNDHRFFYARYDGDQWNVHHLAKAGARLYGSEQDYTGLVALDPHDPDRLFMSSTIDPRDGADLEHHEIFAGITADGGVNWQWEPITFNSQVDNLRPTVPIWDDENTALVWMRGTYRSMFDYDLDIAAITDFGPLAGPILGDLDANGVLDLEDFSQLLASMHRDLGGVTPEQAYARGDLNGDRQVNGVDFLRFRASYNDELGPGAFERALAGVPEQSSIALAAAALFSVTPYLRSAGMRVSRDAEVSRSGAR